MRAGMWGLAVVGLAACGQPDCALAPRPVGWTETVPGVPTDLGSAFYMSTSSVDGAGEAGEARLFAYLDVVPEVGGQLAVEGRCDPVLVAPAGLRLSIDGWLDVREPGVLSVRADPTAPDGFHMEVAHDVPASAWTGPALPDGAHTLELRSYSGAYEGWGTLTAVGGDTDVVLLAW